jgi:hypothetical protein
MLLLLLLLLLLRCVCLSCPSVQQAAGALHKYSVDAVVANLLHTRKDRVLVVKQQPQGVDVVEVLRAPTEPHIEKQLVAEIVQLHQQFRSKAAAVQNSS